MIKISIIGSGNVAHHLLKAFAKSGDVEVVQVVARTKKDLDSVVEPSKLVANFAEMIPVDLVIIAVSDTAIADVSNQIPFENKLVTHTSGSMEMTVLNAKNRRGVFYPLQTFSKVKPVDFNQIPIALEAENQDDYALLETVANSISSHVYQINSEQRKALHVAAVFVCNFVNHLYKIGNDICDENNLPFDLLKPLILETADKIVSLSPTDAQTGPAKREDTVTINEHLKFLKNTTQKDIYKLLTQSIIDHGKKL
jgi:predicted short-subunit dehydrogenase-like oxidoreductase (DUF2520 family)